MNWEEVEIGTVANVLPGFAFKSAHLGDEGTPVVKIGSITNGGEVNFANAQKLPDSHLEPKHERFRLANRDILLAMTGATAGKAGRISAPDGATFLLNQRVAKIEPKAVDPDFLWYVISTRAYRERFFGLGGGAAQPNMSGSQIASIKIPFPPNVVQQKIAGALSAYDNLIENNKRRIVLLEEAGQLLYREWFVHFRFPGYGHVKITDGLPEGWEQQTFSAVCQAVGGGTPSTSNPEYWSDGDIPWYTPTDITRNSCLALLDSEKKITEAGLRGSSAKMLPAGTVLMTSRASVGFFGIIEVPSCTNQGFISILPNDLYTRMYLLLNLMHRVEEIRSHAGGATYKEINKTKFKALSVIMPDSALLRKFEEHTSGLHEQVRTLHTMNQKLAQARDFLLPRLMNGEITV